MQNVVVQDNTNSNLTIHVGFQYHQLRIIAQGLKHIIVQKICIASDREWSESNGVNNRKHGYTSLSYYNIRVALIIFSMLKRSLKWCVIFLILSLFYAQTVDASSSIVKNCVTECSSLLSHHVCLKIFILKHSIRSVS